MLNVLQANIGFPHSPGEVGRGGGSVWRRKGMRGEEREGEEREGDGGGKERRGKKREVGRKE